MRRRETIEGLNDLLHIGWKRLCILLKLPGGGMTETQGPRMQHHAGDLDALYRADLLPAVGLISQNRMAQRCQMDAELVSPACAWVQQHMGGQFAEAMVDPRNP